MTAQTKKFVDVLGRQMAYVDVGSGDPIVFLHGNPTSSYLWRKIIPHCINLGRCLTPDLIGMGDSDNLLPSPGSYTLVEHRRYLDAWFEKLGLTKNVTLIIHDWGCVLGFDWCRRHPDAVKGITYMEAMVMPLRWASIPSSDAFRAFRSTAGEQMVLEDNMFIEAVFPAGMIRKLSREEMAEYRRPGTGFLVPPPSCNASDGTSHADQLRDVARVLTVSLHRHDLESVTRAASPASFMPPYSHLR
jgi:haloalkane dehalogenase